MLTLNVHDIKEETKNFRTFIFKHELNAKPGQFVMIWMPEVDEIPISVGWQENRMFHLGIAKVGDCTEAIFKNIKQGSRLGIRGPFGNPFTLPEDARHIIIVGGGCGTPPLLNLAQKAAKKKIKVSVIIGARSAENLIYEKEFEKLGCTVKVATDDGSKGHKGYCTELLEKMVKFNKPDAIYTCGPELMMLKTAQMAVKKDIPCQVSLERFMKCGFGICGQCCIDGTGLRVCKDGPVFDAKTALKHQEFGKYKRTSSGRRIDY